ncbi:MAG: glycosyltransferase family 2 protein [Planctomycetota bacterium]
MLLDLLFYVSGLSWLVVCLRTLLGSRALPDLGPEPPRDGEGPPTVAAIVAVRDGEHEIGPTLDALLAQQDVELTVIAVDDRSRDGTPALLAARAAQDPRLRPLRIDELPDGWLGKTHACARGATLASKAEWLLFVDADTWIAPGIVARAVRTARRLGTPHFCLVPGFRDQTLPGSALLITLSIGLFLRALELARRSRRKPFGVGAFTLIRSDVYRDVGGHEALRMHVIEDCDLAGNVLQKGHASALRMAVDEFRVHWVSDIRSAFRVLEKNFFALFRFRTALAIAAVVAETASWVIPVLGAVVGSRAGLFAIVCYLMLIPVGVILARRYRSPIALAAAVPLLFPLVPLILFNSVIATLRRGGVRWRETFYPLDRLRAQR